MIKKGAEGQLYAVLGDYVSRKSTQICSISSTQRLCTLPRGVPL